MLTEDQKLEVKTWVALASADTMVDFPVGLTTYVVVLLRPIDRSNSLTTRIEGATYGTMMFFLGRALTEFLNLLKK